MHTKCSEHAETGAVGTCPECIAEIAGWLAEHPDDSPPADPLDVQVGGGHYKGMKIQPVEFMHANNIPYIEGCCIKYLCGHKHKNGAEDIKKVIHYCQLLLQQEYGECQK